MAKNTEALRLPDPLLVRLFREGLIEDIRKVDLDKDRNVTVHLKGKKAPLHFTNLVDVGWVPSETCQSS